MSSGLRSVPRQPVIARGEGRARILEQAEHLFLDSGFADVSMQQIAAAAGVTKATMYHHFRSKEDLFAEVVRLQVNNFWEGIIARADQAADLRDGLTAITRFITERTIDSSAFLRVFSDIRRHISPEMQERIFTEHPTPYNALRHFFQRAIDAGEMRPLDPILLTNMFMGLAMHINHHHGEEHGDFPEPVDANQVVDILMRGISTQPPG